MDFFLLVYCTVQGPKMYYDYSNDNMIISSICITTMKTVKLKGKGESFVKSPHPLAVVSEQRIYVFLLPINSIYVLA